MSPGNRFLRLRAAFTARDDRFARANAYGEALWHGIFDAAYTRPGDYLAQGDAIWFIAAQQRLLPVLCVQTNRIVSFWRPAAPSSTGVNSYGGVMTETNQVLLANWPASVLGASGRGRPDTDLPQRQFLSHIGSRSVFRRVSRASPGSSVGPDDGRSWAQCGGCSSRTDGSRLADCCEAGDDPMADQSDVEVALVSAVGSALPTRNQRSQHTRPRLPHMSRAGRTRPRSMPIWQPARSTSQYFPTAALVGSPPDMPSIGWVRRRDRR